MRPLPVDLKELATVMEGDQLTGGGRLDITTCEVWPAAVFEDSWDTGKDAIDDPDRWLPIENLGSRNGFRDMQEFIGTISNSDHADRLQIAIEGRGAFHRFKNTLVRCPLNFNDEATCPTKANEPGTRLAGRRGKPPDAERMRHGTERSLQGLQPGPDRTALGLTSGVGRQQPREGQAPGTGDGRHCIDR